MLVGERQEDSLGRSTALTRLANAAAVALHHNCRCDDGDESGRAAWRKLLGHVFCFGVLETADHVGVCSFALGEKVGSSGNAPRVYRRDILLAPRHHLPTLLHELAHTAVPQLVSTYEHALGLAHHGDVAREELRFLKECSVRVVGEWVYSDVNVFDHATTTWRSFDRTVARVWRAMRVVHHHRDHKSARRADSGCDGGSGVSPDGMAREEEQEGEEQEQEGQQEQETQCSWLQVPRRMRGTSSARSASSSLSSSLSSCRSSRSSLSRAASLCPAARRPPTLSGLATSCTRDHAGPCGDGSGKDTQRVETGAVSSHGARCEANSSKGIDSGAGSVGCSAEFSARNGRNSSLQARSVSPALPTTFGGHDGRRGANAGKPAASGYGSRNSSVISSCGGDLDQDEAGALQQQQQQQQQQQRQQRQEQQRMRRRRSLPTPSVVLQAFTSLAVCESEGEGRSSSVCSGTFHANPQLSDLFTAPSFKQSGSPSAKRRERPAAALLRTGSEHQLAEERGRDKTAWNGGRRGGGSHSVGIGVGAADDVGGDDGDGEGEGAKAKVLENAGDAATATSFCNGTRHRVEVQVCCANASESKDNALCSGRDAQPASCHAVLLGKGTSSVEKLVDAWEDKHGKFSIAQLERDGRVVGFASSYLGSRTGVSTREQLISVAQQLLRLSVKGLVHGDVRNANVVMCGMGSAYLIDFETVRHEGDSFPVRLDTELAERHPSLLGRRVHDPSMGGRRSASRSMVDVCAAVSSGTGTGAMENARASTGSGPAAAKAGMSTSGASAASVPGKDGRAGGARFEHRTCSVAHDWFALLMCFTIYTGRDFVERFKRAKHAVKGFLASVAEQQERLSPTSLTASPERFSHKELAILKRIQDEVSRAAWP